MLFVRLGLFVELVLVGTSLVLDDGINGVKDLLVGFGIARAITVEDFVTNYHKWYAAHVLIEIFSEILHKGLIIFVAPDFKRININFVFGFGW